MKLKKCRVCGSKDLTPVLSLGKQYLSDFTRSNKKPKAFPLNIVLCKSCKLVQLDYTTPAKFLYTERYGYKSGINQTMKDELKNIVEESLKKTKTKKQLVAVDIGANDGTLLSFLPKSVFRIAVEPIRKLAKESQKQADIVINDYFNFKSYSKKLGNKRADIITIISCFYDMENPNKFVKDVIKIMDDDAVIVIQQNYLVEMLKKNAFDNIVHEHLEYYSLLSLSNLLKKYNLEVFDVKIRELNGGSFRTFIAKKGKKKVTNNVIRMIKMEKQLGLDKKRIYLDFANKIERNKQRIIKLLEQIVEKGEKVYLYGASTRGNTLLQYYNLDNSVISFAVERNPEKWGKKIASVGISIISEKEARMDKPEYMLVLPWFFKKEFLVREKDYLLQGGHLIFPLPTVKVI
jgi:NDP-4-keto-2,6-dideoxyhexose 3-C-methyltransferase